MKACPYCGEKYADEVVECPIDRNKLDVPRGNSNRGRPAWIASVVRLCGSWRIAGAALLTTALFLFLVLTTTEYTYSSGIFRVNKAPFFTLTAAPSDRWIVQSGINYVPRNRLLEFPVYPGYRVGIQVFSER